MIQQTNPTIQVDELMARVREEARAMRAATSAGTRSTTEVLFGGLLQFVPDNASHAQLQAFLDDAALKSAPRSTLPKRFDRAPWSFFRPLFRFLVRVNNYALKDQRHVNAATEMALRVLVSENDKLNQQLKELFMAADERTKALARQCEHLEAQVRELQSVSGHTAQQVSADLDARSMAWDSRFEALESAMTVNAGRIDLVENAELTRVNFVERLESAISDSAHQVARLDSALSDGADRIARLEALTLAAGTSGAPLPARVDAVENAITVNAARIDRIEIADQPSRLGLLERSLAELREHVLRADASIRADLSTQQQMMLVSRVSTTPGVPEDSVPTSGVAYDHILLELADRFRGDSAVIAKRHERYIDLVLESGAVDESHPLIDVGAGRGEWLGLLHDRHIASEGIERSSVLVNRARESGLNMILGDALANLSSRESGSVGAISAFHVIEHLSFETLISLIDESLRALRPGGVLILETPNPANLVVGACNFWLDPTHVRPIPKALAAFLVEQRGFTDVQIMELSANDDARVSNAGDIATRFNDFMYGPQEYAIVARRPE